MIQISEVKDHIKISNIDCSDSRKGDVFQIKELGVVFVHQVSGFSIRNILTNEDLGYIKKEDKNYKL
jgi:hypothetical protein